MGKPGQSFNPYFIEHVTIYPGQYRVRTSLWAFQWDKGKVLPARGTEAARLSVVQLTGDGRGGQHPSTVISSYDAPSMKEKEHELVTWLNHNELIGFNAASQRSQQRILSSLFTHARMVLSAVCVGWYLKVYLPLVRVLAAQQNREALGSSA